MPDRMINGQNYRPPREATYIVAASDAPLHVRRQADYVCDGVADNVEIQAAINAVPTWGVVRLSEGNFVIAAVVLFKNYSYLIGAGIGITTLTAANGLNAIVLSIHTRTYIEVSHLTIDGNGLNQAGDRHGIQVYNSPFVRITDVEVHDARDIGIAVNLSPDCSLLNSLVRDNGHGGASQHGVGVYNSSHRFQAVNCRFIDNVKFGITTQDTGSITDYCTFLACIATGNGLEGFRHRAGKGHRVEGCYSASNGDAGITLDWTTGATVLNNYSLYNDLDGILLAGSYYSTITGNVCNGNGRGAADFHGIALRQYLARNCLYTSVTGNICHDDQGVQTQAYGIRVYASPHNYYVIRCNVLTPNLTGTILDGGTGVNKSVGDNL